jgi:anti-anti-sigma regulatory factor
LPLHKRRSLATKPQERILSISLVIEPRGRTALVAVIYRFDMITASEIKAARLKTAEESAHVIVINIS